MVPDLVVQFLAVVMVSALGLVSWAGHQAFLNYRLTSDPVLKTFARTKLIRASILWVAQATTTLVYVISVTVPRPHSELIQAIVVFALLGLTLAVALLSLQDFLEMRSFFDEQEEG